MKKIKSFLLNIFLNIVSFMPDDPFYSFFLKAIKRRSQKSNPAEYIKKLMELDNELYLIHGQASIEYGKGVHTKHRHINYHNFFIENIYDNETVLDIGCGYGSLTKSIACKTKCGAITAVDISADNINKAKDISQNGKITYVHDDVLKWLDKRHFDVVVLSNVLEHLKNRVKFLQNVRVNATPGRFLIRVPIYERDWRVPLKKELDVEWRLDTTHEVEYLVNEFVEEIEAAGLKVSKMLIKWGEIWAEVI